MSDKSPWIFGGTQVESCLSLNRTRRGMIRKVPPYFENGVILSYLESFGKH